MQKEFVNIAAHEIRTPIQPILGLTVALRSKMIKPIGVSVAQSVIGGLTATGVSNNLGRE